MNDPQTIPWLFCGALCMLPFIVGISAYQISHAFAKRVPRWTWDKIERDGRTVRTLEYSLITREKKAILSKTEKEADL